MKYAILLVLLVLTACSNRTVYYEEPPQLVSIHLIDRDGMTEAIANSERLKNFEDLDFLSHQPYQKVLRVFGRDCKGDVHALITTYHPNGQIRQYLEIVNNRAFGSYREWYANGNLKVDATVVEGSADVNLAAEKTWLFDGCSKAYSECGDLIASFYYCRGSLEGTSFYYHPNGVIWKEIPYTDNKVCGEMKIFLDSGDLLQTTSYSNGLKSGSAIRYWPNGTIATDEIYQQGKLISGIYRTPEGNAISQISQGNGHKALFGKDILTELHEYRAGVPHGEVAVYNSEGQLTKRYAIKNGLKHGEEIIYYPSFGDVPPQPKLSISWYEGKIQGLVKTWYDDKGMESQREMSDNARNGVSTVWYRDGQLMMIEEYENDRLKKGDYYRKGHRQPLTQIIQGEGTATLFDPEGNYLRKIPYLNGKPDK